MIAALVLVFIIVVSLISYVYIVFPLTNTNTTPPASTPTSTPLSKPRISTDVNWGGYAVATNFSQPLPVVTEVSASWVVPQVKASATDTFLAIWVGIGGTFGNTLIQVGTEQDSLNGQPTYYAWYELLPTPSVPIFSVAISPGDKVLATVKLLDSATNQWSIYIINLSNQESFNQTFSYTSSQLSAEWIVERPTVNGKFRALADFGQISMSNCTLTLNGVSGDLADFNYVKTVLVNQQRIPLLKISDVGNDKASFTVSYLPIA